MHNNGLNKDWQFAVTHCQPVSPMNNNAKTTKCADCGAQIASEADALDMSRPCDACGSTKRVYSVSVAETLMVRDGFSLKAKRPGQNRPYLEDLSMPEYSHSRRKYVHRQRVIDRDNDQYIETITDYENGEVIHHCEELLSQHQGHGDAKRKSV